jgi:hypothetical protein
MGSVMQCRICDGLAEELPNTIDGMSIHCDRCGDYDISGSVADGDLLQPFDPEERRVALESAKRSAPQGKRPMITTYSLPGRVVFVGRTLQEANHKAEAWLAQQRGLRIVGRLPMGTGFTGPSLKGADQFTVTIRFEIDRGHA